MADNFKGSLGSIDEKPEESDELDLPEPFDGFPAESNDLNRSNNPFESELEVKPILDASTAFGTIQSYNYRLADDQHAMNYSYTYPDKFTVGKGRLDEQNSNLEGYFPKEMVFKYDENSSNKVTLESPNFENLQIGPDKLAEEKFKIVQEGEFMDYPNEEDYELQRPTHSYLWTRIFRDKFLTEENGLPKNLEVEVSENWKKYYEQRILHIKSIEGTKKMKVFMFEAIGCIKNSTVIICQCKTEKECGCYKLAIAVELNDSYQKLICAEVIPTGVDQQENNSRYIQDGITKVAIGDTELNYPSEWTSEESDDKIDPLVDWPSKLDELIQ